MWLSIATAHLLMLPCCAIILHACYTVCAQWFKIINTTHYEGQVWPKSPSLMKPEVDGGLFLLDAYFRGRVTMLIQFHNCVGIKYVYRQLKTRTIGLG